MRVKQSRYAGLILLYQPIVIFSSKSVTGGALSSEELFANDCTARQNLRDGQSHYSSPDRKSCPSEPPVVAESAWQAIPSTISIRP